MTIPNGVKLAQVILGAVATGAAIVALAPIAPALAVGVGAASIGAMAAGGIYSNASGGNFADGAANGAMVGEVASLACAGAGVGVASARAAVTVATGIAEAASLGVNPLMNELANSGVKYNAEKVLTVVKNTAGKLLWLEEGNANAGLTHIIQRHGADLAAQGVENIPKFIEKISKMEPIIEDAKNGGLYAEYLVDGELYRLAYGTNGFIVSLFPIGGK